jgi:hypothetical protein
MLCSKEQSQPLWRFKSWAPEQVEIFLYQIETKKKTGGSRYATAAI